MQVRHSPYRGLLHCAQATWREEGLRAFYKSYWTTVGLLGLLLRMGSCWWHAALRAPQQSSLLLACLGRMAALPAAGC